MKRVRVISVMAAAAVVACSFAVAASAAGAKTVWLCLAGHAPDPCAPSLSTTVYTPKLKKLDVQHLRRVANPAIDCFYVYPTVSGQPTGNSNLVIGPAERSVALYQAARYSQNCRVYAPMYRQVTLAALGTTGTAPTTPPNPALGLADVRAAFATYLKKYNHGRGFVLIGHSQGSGVLRELIALDVDRKPAVRKHLVSAILMGGNVLVKKGSDIGGDFQHIPACRSATELHCVIAFSTFDEPVPADSLFGRPTQLPGTPAAPKDTVVLCTNPAALAGGSGVLNPIFPTAPFFKGSSLYQANLLLKLKTPHAHTTWWTEPGAYRARCSSANGANVLEITPLRGAVKPAPSPTPAWGLHLLDANVALGNPVAIVDKESAAYVAQGGK
ncbi:MAG: DUF3089 domain-containing protein [Solirubrobacteraceae bacterium]